MAAKPKYDARPGAYKVKLNDFTRIVEVCENAPAASPELRSFVARGRRAQAAA